MQVLIISTLVVPVSVSKVTVRVSLGTHRGDLLFVLIKQVLMKGSTVFRFLRSVFFPSTGILKQI